MNATDRRFIMFILFLVTIILTFMTYYFDKQVATLNNRIESLEATINTYSLENKDLMDRLTSYKVENNEIQDRVVSYEIDIQEIPSPDLLLLAQLIEAESGNQSFEGKLAVGTVVMNRVESKKFPDNIKDVIYQKNQFSVVSNGRISNKPSNDALKAATMVLNGVRSLGSDVLYFYNPKLVRAGNWIRKLKINTVIQDHAFAV